MKSNPMVIIQGDQLATNTRIIAEYFGKQHKNVIRALRHLMADSPDSFNQLNYELVDYIDSKGEERSMYNVTKDGFMLLAMGFTGSQVTEMKIAFIEEFNRMEAELLAKGALIPILLGITSNYLFSITYVSCIDKLLQD